VYDKYQSTVDAVAKLKVSENGLETAMQIDLCDDCRLRWWMDDGLRCGIVGEGRCFRVGVEGWKLKFELRRRMWGGWGDGNCAATGIDEWKEESAMENKLKSRSLTFGKFVWIS
jgi:hypothetical protein